MRQGSMWVKRPQPFPPLTVLVQHLSLPQRLHQHAAWASRAPKHRRAPRRRQAAALATAQHPARLRQCVFTTWTFAVRRGLQLAAATVKAVVVDVGRHERKIVWRHAFWDGAGPALGEAAAAAMCAASRPASSAKCASATASCGLKARHCRSSRHLRPGLHISADHDAAHASAGTCLALQSPASPHDSACQVRVPRGSGGLHTCWQHV